MGFMRKLWRNSDVDILNMKGVQGDWHGSQIAAFLVEGLYYVVNMLQADSLDSLRFY